MNLIKINNSEIEIFYKILEKWVVFLLLFVIEDFIKNILSFLPLIEILILFLKYNIISFKSNVSSFIFFKLFKILNSIDLYDKFKNYFTKYLKYFIFLFLNFILKLCKYVDNNDIELISKEIIELNSKLKKITNENNIKSSIILERMKSKSNNKCKDN